MSLSLQQLAGQLNLEFRGDPDLEIGSVASLTSADAGDLCFVQQRKYLAALSASRCGAVILPAELADEAGERAMLLSDEPYFQFIRAIGLLQPDHSGRAGGVDASAIVAPSASLGERIGIGAGAIIGENVVVGDGTTIGAGCIIEADVSIGSDCELHAGVVLRHSISLGNRCVLQSGHAQSLATPES